LKTENLTCENIFVCLFYFHLYVVEGSLVSKNSIVVVFDCFWLEKVKIK